MATVEHDGTLTIMDQVESGNGAVYTDLLYRFDPNDTGPSYQTLPYFFDSNSPDIGPQYTLLPFFFDRDEPFDFGNGLSEYERTPGDESFGFDFNGLGLQTLEYRVRPGEMAGLEKFMQDNPDMGIIDAWTAYGELPADRLAEYEALNTQYPNDIITLPYIPGEDDGPRYVLLNGDPTGIPTDNTNTVTLTETGEAPMAGENNNALYLLLTETLQQERFQSAMHAMGVTQEEFDATAREAAAPHLERAQEILNGAGISATTPEELQAALQNNPAVAAEIGTIGNEALQAIGQSIEAKFTAGEIGQRPENQPAPAADEGADAAAPDGRTVEEATPAEAAAAAPDGRTVEEATPAEPAVSSIPAEGYTTEAAQITAMQEVMMLPEIVALTGMNGHQFGNPQTGEADGIKGSGTDAAFAALAQAAGGRPDIAVFLEEQGVSAEDVQKFTMAHASYVGAGNASPIVLPSDPNAVANIQTALRANDAQIGLSLNGIDPNTGSSVARDQSDNNLGPLTARAIQGTVALAIASQAPEGTDVTHELTDENIGYVQAYLTEQGIEGADQTAASLRMIANDPALSAQYEQNVVPDSIEYAGLSIPGTEDGAAVASVADEVDGVAADTPEEAADVAATPAALGSDFGAQTNGGLATATLTVSEFEALRDNTDYAAAGSDEIRLLGSAALELEGLPAYQERTALIEQQAASIEDMRSGAVREQAIAMHGEANALDSALTEELRGHEFEIDYTYTTGRNGREVTHEATFNGTMAEFEEEFGSGGFLNVNQQGEASLRPKIEAAYAELEASPEIVARREEIAAMRVEASGLEQSHLDAFVERRGRVEELDAQLAETELQIIVPDDMDQAAAETLITDAGGTFTPAEAAPADAAPAAEVAADAPAEPAAEGAEVVAEDTTAPPPGEVMALNTRAPGMGSNFG